MNSELQMIYNKVKNKEHFALVRFGDGERNIMNNVSCNRNGFSFNTLNEYDKKFRQELIESYKFKCPRYYKGIGDENLITDVCELVSACVFVNENYVQFLNNFNKLFDNCIFIGNELGMKWQLPFTVERYIRIKENAWKDYNSNLLDVYLSKYLEKKKDKIILVAGGPMSNVLIYKLYKNNPDNIYLNIGSTMDPFIYGFFTRKYQERLCQ